MNGDVKGFGFMKIDFGSINNYHADRGFGFVGRTFCNSNGKVFFHIKKIKKKHPELAQKLDNNEAFETINFWYEIEITEKGEQVNKVWLNTENIPQNYTHELSDLSQKVESIWKNVDSPKPSWLDLVTIELVGVDRKHELSVERDNLESQLKAAEEERRREAEALRQNEIIRIAKEHKLTKPEADELEQLLAEMRPLNFKYSKQLSEYIVKHELGYNYQHISGTLRMRQGGREWDFHGGLSPRIYNTICKELDLDNQGSDAEPGEFTPYKDIYINKSRIMQ
jgi:cold shock CspA family protein